MPEPAQRLSPARLPSQRFATTENAITDRELARSLAMETAAKIDQIESEMARDFLRPRSPAGNTPARGTGEVAATGELSTTVVDGDTVGEEFLGSVDAIEIHTSGAGSVIDESAILFANGQMAEAEQVLRAGIAADDLGHATQNAWLMLFELLNQRGDRAAFEQLAAQYAVRFQTSAPAWIDYSCEPARAPAAPAVGAPPGVRLPVNVDATVVKTLEQLKTLAASHAALTLDASAVRRVDLVGAELLLRVVTAFKRASHELTIAGAQQLLNPLRALIEPGRRDASDAAWMLLLELLRLLGRQAEFEETAIQYCITFEVSPPQWEPPPPNIKLAESTPRHPAVAREAEPEAAADDSTLIWRGVIEGEGEPWLGRLALQARSSKRLTVDALQLRRMAFSTASSLLTLLMRLQQSGVMVEFRNVNPLLGALFHLLGITAVAGVQLRRP
ncbi:MAG: STAS domain-containing protein [Sutterellaceae bacterium]|nr:STAS domain-containing protein [Burkholderiaceae bacterium]MCX7901644.1 STAS domain-containing protein [Burkholderiaceae bacterium]MDW8430031.1 STAS domain-containing protein [Sutterellaceae bacterium]